MILILENGNRELNNQNGTLLMEMDKLTDNNIKREDELTKDLKKANDANKGLTNTNNNLTKANEDLTKANGGLTKELEATNKQITELKAISGNLSNDNAKSEFNSLCPDKESYQKFMDGLNGGIKLCTNYNNKEAANSLKQMNTMFKKFGEEQGYERHGNSENKENNKDNRHQQTLRIKGAENEINNRQNNRQNSVEGLGSSQSQSKTNDNAPGGPPPSPKVPGAPGAPRVPGYNGSSR